MTEQERATKAQTEIQVTLDKYGCTIVPGLPSVELHGDLYFLKSSSQISIAPVPGWVEKPHDTTAE